MTAMLLCRNGLISWRNDLQRVQVKVGAFSKAEDEALLSALREFAEQQKLDPNDLSWVNNMTAVKHGIGKSRSEGFMKQVWHAIWLLCTPAKASVLF